MDIKDIIYDVLMGDVEIEWYCGECDEHLPKDEWSILTEGGKSVASIECPACGEYNTVSVE